PAAALSNRDGHTLAPVAARPPSSMPDQQAGGSKSAAMAAQPLGKITERPLAPRAAQAPTPPPALFRGTVPGKLALNSAPSSISGRPRDTNQQPGSNPQGA